MTSKSLDLPSSSPSYMLPLHERLNTCESLLLTGSFLSCYHTVCAILDDLIALTNPLTHKKLSPTTGLLLHHKCVVQCICQSCVITCIQCLYESNQLDYELINFIDKYYLESINMPYNVYIVYIQLFIPHRKYDYICENIVQYIHARSANKSNTIQYNNSNSNNNTNPAAIRPPINIRYDVLNDTEYTALVEILIFNGLLPLHMYNDALKLNESSTQLNIFSKQQFNARIKSIQSDYNNDADESMNKQLQERTTQLQANKLKSAALINNNNSAIQSQQPTEPDNQHRLIMIIDYVYRFVSTNKIILLILFIVIQLCYRQYKLMCKLNHNNTVKQIMSNEDTKNSLYGIVKREMRNLFHLAFSNMVGQSISSAMNGL